jgi:hypothetical protein
MSDPLEPEELDALAQELEKESQRGRLRIGAGCSFVLDSCSGDPGRNALIGRLKDKLGPYIDFNTGGLKIYETRINGQAATFSIVPGWTSAPENGARGMGGPSITIKFHMKF